MSAQLGLRLKQRGIDAVEESNFDWVSFMRELAQTHSDIYGSVTADNVRNVSEKTARHPKHPNAYGAVFKGKGWKAIGYTQSQHPSNHGRTIRVWRWVG